MARILEEGLAVDVVAALLGVANADRGPTAEQRAVISSLASGYFHQPLDLDEVTPVEASVVAERFRSDAERRRVRELMVFVELCRHPLTAAQVERTELFARALGADDETMVVARDFVARGADQATADYIRFISGQTAELVEPSLADRQPDFAGGSDPELAERLAALGECAEGTLGRSFVEFYERNGIDLPGTTDGPAAIFVAHDMTHVIGGYEPDGVGEIALGAMQLAMTDSDAHWIQFLGNLGVHEAGYLGGDFQPKQATLTRPNAPAVVAHAFDRGARCTGDFTVVDHLSMADRPLEEVRARYGVPPREL